MKNADMTELMENCYAFGFYENEFHRALKEASSLLLMLGQEHRDDEMYISFAFYVLDELKSIKFSLCAFDCLKDFTEFLRTTKELDKLKEGIEEWVDWISGYKDHTPTGRKED